MNDEITESLVTPLRTKLGYLSIFFAMVFLGYGIIVLELDPHIPIIFATITAGILAIIVDKQKWEFIEKGMIASITVAMQSMIILMIIGMLIASWIMGGIVPTMITYGLDIINPKYFYFAAALLSSIIALSIGSSWTTAGTIGIALIGIASALGLSLPMAAGAIISGAYVGDKMSPLSDTTNLAPAISGTTVFEHIKSMSYTTIPSFVIVLLLYLLIGLFGSQATADISTISEFKNILSDSFVISPILLLPPVLIIVMVIFKIPAMPGLLVSVLLGSLSAYYIQGGVSLGDILGSLHYGYELDVSIYTGIYSEDVVATIGDLLNRGGLDSMLWTVSLIILAMCFGGILETSGFLESVVDSLKVFIKSPLSLVTVSIFTAIIINIVTADQYIAIILPGKMFKKNFERFDLDPNVQSRILESGGTLTSALVPWNTCGATMTKYLGVSTLAYAPFAFLNILNPIMEIIFAGTNTAMFKNNKQKA